MVGPCWVCGKKVDSDNGIEILCRNKHVMHLHIGDCSKHMQEALQDAVAFVEQVAIAKKIVDELIAEEREHESNH